MNKLFNTYLYRCSIYVTTVWVEINEHFNSIEDSIICSNLHDDIAHLKFYFFSIHNGWNLKCLLELKVLNYCDICKKNVNYSIDTSCCRYSIYIAFITI